MVRFPASHLHTYQSIFPRICRGPLPCGSSRPGRYLCRQRDRHAGDLFCWPGGGNRKARDRFTLLPQLRRDRDIFKRELQTGWSSAHHGRRRYRHRRWGPGKVIHLGDRRKTPVLHENSAFIHIFNRVIHTFCTELSTKKRDLPTRKCFLTLSLDVIMSTITKGMSSQWCALLLWTQKTKRQHTGISFAV